MTVPLAEKLRPISFNEIVGQNHLLEENSWLKKSIKEGKPYSLLLHGPPGSGKTTFGRIYAKNFEKPYLFKSAVTTSITEIKKILEEKKKAPLFLPCILFLDEIHRYNRAKQDLFLPFVEEGRLILIGATTESPSFAINNALLSRLRLVNFKLQEEEGLAQILDRFEKKIGVLGLTEKAKSELLACSSGDARYLINLIELLYLEDKPIDETKLVSFLQKKAPIYDKNKDGHYQLISCLHKTIRGSDPDAALYWLYRMLNAGEEPLFIARRLIRIATEDIGLADPQALSQALAAFDTYSRLGSPEGELSLAQACVYLALSPKSNRLYLASKKAQELAEKTSDLSAPNHLVNPVGDKSVNMEHGKGYVYDHDAPFSFLGQNFFPDKIKNPSIYIPKEIGFEKELKKRSNFFKTLREKMKKETS